LGAPPPPQPAYRSPDEPDPDPEKDARTDGLPSFNEIVPPEVRSQGRSAADALVEVPVAGNRTLEVQVSGPEWGTPLVFHHGIPFAAAPWPAAAEAAARHGLRWVQWSRPGYGASDRMEGRDVAAAAHDAEAVLDALGHQSFLSLGWSAGGPHALACASLLADRCLAVATLGSPTPVAAGVWEQAESGFGSAIAAAVQGMAGAQQEVRNRSSQLRCQPGWLDGESRGDAEVLPEVELVSDLASVFGSPLAAADVVAVTSSASVPLGHALARGVGAGVGGWCDDLVALGSEWGFDLSAVSVPVAVWHGSDDLWVPVPHATWLADQLQRPHLRPVAGQGHVSMILNLLDAVVEDLVDLSRTSTKDLA
jgi:pimeloyl-ACP methyl ester carboxylesterase